MSFVCKQLKSADVIVYATATLVMARQQKTFHLGNNLFVEPVLDGVRLVQCLTGIPNAAKSNVFLGAKEFKRLLDVSNVLKSSLKKRPASAKTLADYEVLFHHQTKFLLGKSVYVKINYEGSEPQIHFREYTLFNSIAVPGESVVCAGRFLIALNRKQFDELWLRRKVLRTFQNKPVPVLNKTGNKRKPEAETVKSDPRSPPQDSRVMTLPPKKRFRSQELPGTSSQMTNQCGGEMKKLMHANKVI